MGITYQQAINCQNVYWGEPGCKECELYSKCTSQTQADIARLTISALEKQISKNPILDSIYHQQYYCPNCGDFLVRKGEGKPHHCSCGQAISWEIETTCQK